MSDAKEKKPTEAALRRAQKEKERLFLLTEYERPLWAEGILPGGMDEVGRGPLAGPVVAACAVLPPEPLVEGVNDSKKLSEKKREALFELLKEQAQYGIGVVDQTVIDEINILRATRKAFCMAFEQMKTRPEVVLVDAMASLPIEAKQISLIKGDAKSYVIGAASILAKVIRDRMMVEYDRMYPQYGFARNKGYGTAEHIEAIRKYGPCPLHRRSFIQKWL